MKVLKKGRPQKGWSAKAECTGNGNEGGGCGAQLLVEQDDLYRTESHARDEVTNYFTFTCADCGVETDLLSGNNVGAPRPPHNVVIPSRAAWKRKQEQQR